MSLNPDPSGAALLVGWPCISQLYDSLGDVSVVMRGHVQRMLSMRYQVFVQHDGSYGVVLSQIGAIVRTAIGFANRSDAQSWAVREIGSDNADYLFQKSDRPNLKYLSNPPQRQRGDQLR